VPEPDRKREPVAGAARQGEIGPAYARRLHAQQRLAGPVSR
jgi:hypothetical protein